MENIMKSRKVIIWGVDDYNVLGLFRQLGLFDFDITFMVFQGVRRCATLSKYCTHIVETPSLEDGLKYLLENFRNQEKKAVIINSNDLIAEFLDFHREELSRWFIVPGTSKPGLLKEMDDKSRMTAIAKDLGFNVPNSCECKWDSNIDNVSFPCLLKPTHQTLGHYNEFKFKICNNKKELERTLRFVRKQSTFILQDYIPKESVALVYGCRTLDGKTHLAGVLEKDRFCDNGDGSHGVLMEDFPEYINQELIYKFIEKVDFYGLFSVEYLVYQRKAYFIEVNWRNDGTSHLFYQAGANLPLLWLMSSWGEEQDSIPSKITKRCLFIDEIFDKDNIRKGKVTKEQWKKEREEATVFKYYDKEDITPYETVKKGRRKKLLIDSIVAKNRLYIVWILDKLGLKRN